MNATRLPKIEIPPEYAGRELAETAYRDAATRFYWCGYQDGLMDAHDQSQMLATVHASASPAVKKMLNKMTGTEPEEDSRPSWWRWAMVGLAAGMAAALLLCGCSGEVLPRMHL